MSTRTASSSSASGKVDGRAREFFWGITLNKDKPEHTWTLKDEDDDADFLEHTLFLRHAVLGKGSTDGERNLVSVETQNYSGDKLDQPLFSLTTGKTDMCQLDINFGSEQPVTFKLLEGEGPVHLSAQQLVEFPPDDLDETEFTATEDEEEEEDDAESPEPKGKKRKATDDKTGKKKKGKASEEEEDEDDDDDEDEESMDDDDDESEASSPEKKTKKKASVKSKVTAKPAKKGDKAPAKKGKKK